MTIGLAQRRPERAPVSTAMESARRPAWAVRWSRWSRSPRTDSSECRCSISRRSASMLVDRACIRPAALAQAAMAAERSVSARVARAVSRSTVTPRRACSAAAAEAIRSFSARTSETSRAVSAAAAPLDPGRLRGEALGLDGGGGDQARGLGGEPLGVGGELGAELSARSPGCGRRRPRRRSAARRLRPRPKPAGSVPSRGPRRRPTGSACRLRLPISAGRVRWAGVRGAIGVLGGGRCWTVGGGAGRCGCERSWWG